MGLKPRRQPPTAGVSKRLLKDLHDVAKMPGRSHHDGGLVILPKEAHDLLTMLRSPIIAQLERQLTKCQAENEKLLTTVKEGRLAIIENRVLRGIVSALQDGVKPLDLGAK